MKQTRPRDGGQRGQSLLEFALALPILAILLVGAAGLGRYAYDVQIVRQSMIETGKMAINDRTNPATGTAYQLSNTELFRYLRDIAHEQDNAIAGQDLTLPNVDPAGKSCAGGNNCAAWQFKPSASRTDKGALDDFQKMLDIGLAIHKGSCHNDTANVLSFLNPGLETMRVNFQYNTGLGGGYKISPQTFEYNFSRYQMLSFPLNFPEGGCIQDDGWAH
jgi:hypothetical protein